MATIKAKDLAAICRTMADLRAATLALGSEGSERIAQAFDSATRDLAATLKPYNPNFNAARFMAEAGASAGSKR